MSLQRGASPAAAMMAADAALATTWHMTMGLTPPDDLTSGATTALRRTRVASLRALPVPMSVAHCAKSSVPP
eukprot:10944973-Alexandrium_andersonii.AAC.1